MNVSALQKHLSDLSGFLKEAGAALKVYSDIERIRDKLTAFRSMSLKEFGDFLEKAEEYHRTGKLTSKKSSGTKSSGKSKKSAEEVARVKSAIVDLYNRATDPNLSVEQIEAGVKELEDTDLKLTELKALAKSIDISRPTRTKADVIKAIRQHIMERKGAYQRADS